MKQRCVLVLAIASCRTEASGARPDVVAAPAAASSTTPAPARPRCELAPGEAELELTVGALRRHYLVHVGAELADPPAVLFTWHGFGSNAAIARRSLQGATLWNDAIVVAPQGEPRTFEQFGPRARPGWQIAKGELGDRDLAFFDAIVADLEARGCLDRRRVYSTGFSNGGFFTNVLACHRGDVLAAVAPAGGGGPFVERCDAGALPILITHGRGDEVVEYEMAERSFTHWIAHNGCKSDARPPADGCADAPGCPRATPVRMCSFGIGHEWPEDQSRRTADFLRGFTRP